MAKKGKPEPKKKMTPTPPKPATPAPKSTSKRTTKTAVRKATNIATGPTKATAAYADLDPTAPPPAPGNIPWGYGDVRIVGMARDPLWACCYWEVSDDAIHAAKQKLKDQSAWLSLRIYDTTGREFNGLNAHLHWDLGIDRGTPSYHFKVGKPGVTIHVDVGVRNHHGDFAPIARSNAIEMPRDAVSGDTRSDFTTVFRNGPPYTYEHRYYPAPGAPQTFAPDPGPGQGPAFHSQHPAESEQMFKHLAGEGWTRSEWMESLVDGRTMRWIRWSGPVMADHLLLLPKTGATYRTIEVLFQGEKKIIKFEGGEKIVYGPWKVLVEAVGSEGERKTVEQWMIRQRWTTHEGMARIETPAIITRILGGRRVSVVQAGSEARLVEDQWGSELMQQGASEWRWLGASENMLQGSSEVLQRGSSELFYLGSSERLFQGSSEMLYLGASETFSLGASERYFGSSDHHLGGSSEERP